MNNLLQSFPRMRFAAAIIAVIGIVLIISGISEHSAQSAPREHLFMLEDDVLQTRQYLDCSVDMIFENYAETVEEESTFGFKTSERPYSQHYIIPCVLADGTMKFVSAEVSYVPYQQTFNRILENTYSEDETLFQTDYMEFTGRVKPLDPELRQFAYETMLDYGYVADMNEFNQIFISQEISVLNPNAYNVAVMVIIGAVAILLGAGLFAADIAITKRKALQKMAEQGYMH
jgi:hypothetical protein